MDILRSGTKAQSQSRLIEKFFLAWMVAGLLVAVFGFWRSGYVLCMPEPYLPAHVQRQGLCPSEIPILLRLFSVLLGLGGYVIAALFAAVAMLMAERRFSALSERPDFFSKAFGLVLTLCSLPVGFLLTRFIANLSLGWLLTP